MRQTHAHTKQAPMETFSREDVLSHVSSFALHCSLCGQADLGLRARVLKCTKCKTVLDAKETPKAVVHVPPEEELSETAFCDPCFSKLHSGTPILQDRVCVTEKKALERMTLEEFAERDDVEQLLVTCVDCGRHFHDVCALVPPCVINRTLFRCCFCTIALSDAAAATSSSSPSPSSASQTAKRAEQRTDAARVYRADRLGSSPLSRAVEARIRQLVSDPAASSLAPLGSCTAFATQPQSRSPQPEDFTVRVIARRVSQGHPLSTARRFGVPDSITYTSEFLLLFQRRDGVDVAVFGLQAYLYDDACEYEPNRGTSYLGYIEKTGFFHPREWGTRIIQEFVIAFLQHTRAQYPRCYIWSAPAVDKDYIFWARKKYRGPGARVTHDDVVRLRNWYAKLLLLAQEAGIVRDWTSLQVHLEHNQMPYFWGDLWPNLLEKDVLTKKSKSTEAFWNGLCKTADAKEYYFVVNLVPQNGSKVLSPGIKNGKRGGGTSPGDVRHDDDDVLRIFRTADTFLEWCKRMSFQFNDLQHAKYSSIMVRAPLPCTLALATPMFKFRVTDQPLCPCLTCTQIVHQLYHPGCLIEAAESAAELLHEHGDDASIEALQWADDNLLRASQYRLHPEHRSLAVMVAEPQFQHPHQVFGLVRHLEHWDSETCKAKRCKACASVNELLARHQAMCDRDSCPVKKCNNYVGGVPAQSTPRTSSGRGRAGSSSGGSGRGTGTGSGKKRKAPSPSRAVTPRRSSAAATRRR